jgi:hypothetical protein
MLSYQLSVCALLISVLMAVFSSQPSRIGAYFSMFFGVSSFLVFYFSQITLPKEPLCIAISLLGYFLGKGIDSLQSNQQNKGNNSA